MQDYYLMQQTPDTSGAYGAFTLTHDISHWTKASLFSHTGKQTECFARFSTLDDERAPRGFDVKFFTAEGDWDLAGTNIPVHFARDPRTDPPRHVSGFWPLSPESLHYITLLFSDRGAPDGYRHMHGYANRTVSLTNSENKLAWCKFHFKTMQGIRSAAHEHPGRDLDDAIAAGNFPKWRVFVQILTETDKLDYNPFDPTKVWPHSQFPLHEVGIIELNRAPAGAGKEAFDPANLVPGIGHPPENVLHAPADDDYAQPGNLFRLMSPPERERLIANLVSIMQGVPELVLLKQIAHFFLCDPAYGKLVADGLGLSLDQALAPETASAGRGNAP
jgi:catalase